MVFFFLWWCGVVVSVRLCFCDFCDGVFVVVFWCICCVGGGGGLFVVVLSNIAQSSAEVMAVLKDNHQTSPMSSKTAQSSIEVMDVVKDCHETSRKFC